MVQINRAEINRAQINRAQINRAQVKSPGLRERHREGRRQGILRAAAELFRTSGYDNTSVEEIAAQAEVSVPTIYSFFSSKHDLLLGLLEEDRRHMRAVLEPLLHALPADPLKALIKVAQTCLEQGFVDISHKPIWREISAAALKASPGGRESALRFQGMHVEAFQTFLQGLRRDRIIRRDLDLESVARSLYAVSRNCFRIYLMVERASVADLRAMLRKDLSTVFRGLLAGEHTVRRQTKRSARR